MNNSINITEIMSGIKLAAKDIPDFEDVPYTWNAGSAVPENPDDAISEMRSYCYIHSYRQIHGKKIKVFLKKAVRKIIKFYTEPIVDEQNDFNASAEAAVTSLRNTQKKLIKRIEKLEAENKRLIKDLYGE